MVELVKDQGSEYDTHSLDASAQHAIQLLAVALLQLHAKTSVGPHASSMRQNISGLDCFTKTFSSGQRPPSPAHSPERATQSGATGSSVVRTRPAPGTDRCNSPQCGPRAAGAYRSRSRK